jgi:hypothetical protein
MLLTNRANGSTGEAEDQRPSDLSGHRPGAAQRMQQPVHDIHR